MNWWKIWLLFVLNFICVYSVESLRYMHVQSRYRNGISKPVKSPPVSNTRPVIGILSQELSQQIYRLCTLATYRSYIAASYVKYIESAGARVVPIRIGQPDSYYEEIVNSVNGILFPGGAESFETNNGFVDAAKKIYNLAIKLGVPIWGTCFGFQILVYFTSGKDIRAKCNIHDKTLPLHFEMDYAKSRVYKNAPYEVINLLKRQPILANTHTFCITPKNVTKYKVDKDWLILSTSSAENVTYITSVESRNHRIWGVQFHPEKNSFEWLRNHYDHTLNGVTVSQYFANFFIQEARYNNNTFSNKRREMDLLIYNYVPLYTAKHGCPFEQLYVLN